MSDSRQKFKKGEERIPSRSNTERESEEKLEGKQRWRLKQEKKRV